MNKILEEFKALTAMNISNPSLEIIPSSNEGIWKALYLYKQGVHQVQVNSNN